MKFLIYICILFFHVTLTHAWELEGFAGAQSTTYDDVEEANSAGLSARTKINFYTQNKGMFVNLNSRGISLIAADLMVGYGWRTSDSWFFEAGLGGSISAIYGTNIGALVGTGYRFSNSLFINFPVIISGPGIFWSPYIGYSF